MIDPRLLESIRNPAAGLSNIGAMYAKGVEMKQNKEKMDMEREKLDTAQAAHKMAIFQKKANFAGRSSVSLSEITDPEERLAEQKRIAGTDMGKAFGFNFTERALSDNELGTLLQQSDEGLEWATLSAKGKKGIDSESGTILNAKGDVLGTGFRSGTSGVAYIDDPKSKSGFSRIPENSRFVKGESEGVLEASKDPYTKGDAKAQQKTRESIMEHSLEAERSMPTLNRINNILDDPNWEQGTFAEVGANLGNLAQRMGIPIPDEWTPDEAYIVMGAAAQQVINNMGQIKGNLNREEVKIAVDASMGITNPKQAARVKIKAAREIAIRDQERQIEMEKHPKDLSGFKAKWLDRNKNKQIIKRRPDGKGGVTVHFYSEAKANARKYFETNAKSNGLTGQDYLDSVREGMENFHKEWAK